MSKKATEPAETHARKSDRPNYPEDAETLWFLTIAPTTWAVHFLLCYIAAAVWSAKFESLRDIFVPVAVATLVALAVIGWTGWKGWRRHRVADDSIPHDFDSPEDRHQFLGFATLLLAGLSAVATLFTAVVFLIVGEAGA